MKEVTTAQAKHMTAPCPVANMCTRNDEGITNIAPISFYTFLSLKHDIICFEAGKGKYTSKLLVKTGEVGITIPGEDIAEQTMACGKCCGRDVDKAAEYGIEMMPVEGFHVVMDGHAHLEVAGAGQESRKCRSKGDMRELDEIDARCGSKLDERGRRRLPFGERGPRFRVETDDPFASQVGQGGFQRSFVLDDDDAAFPRKDGELVDLFLGKSGAVRLCRDGVGGKRGLCGGASTAAPSTMNSGSFHLCVGDVSPGFTPRPMMITSSGDWLSRHGRR